MTDLDDFFAKKDKKKPGKKTDSPMLKTTSDLFKVLDNTAQNGQREEQESESNKVSRKEVQLTPVLAEILNLEEASKWEDPVDEERQYDLTNLKIESLQSPEEDDEAIAAANIEAAKPAKVWKVPKKEEPVKDKSPDGATKQAEPEQVSTGSSVKEVEKKDVRAVDYGKIQEQKAIDELKSAPAKDEALVSSQVEEKKPETKPAETTEKPKYVPPSMRNLPAAAPAAAPAPAASTAPTKTATSTQSAPGSVYISPGQRHAQEAEALEKKVLFGGGGSSRLSAKKPELNDEEEFPSLGGPPSKHK